ncbi:ATP-grasp domain-containing protein [Streptomyces sp. NPDC020742]|uniref:ATP-grasp domain-containing protein n=1 Tax=Streptomyces sp. NPDC020742 TaxID=3154897 RepID=UPI0033E89F8C
MSDLVLFVESNTTGTGREFARRAASLGAVPVLVTTDPDRYPYVRADGLRHIVADTSVTEEVLRVAAELQRDGTVRGVTSSSEYYVPTAAAVARSLGLPGPAPEQVSRCRNKGAQRRVLHEAGVPVPAFEVVTSEAEAASAATRLGLPVVVKPVLGSGSLGVRLCADERAVAEHAAELLAHTTNERGMSLPREVLVESYVRGREFSVEMFGSRVVTVVRKHIGPLPHFVELGHDVPAGLRPEERDLLGSLAQRAVRALGLGWGASHTEIRLDGGRGHVVEVNPRLAGGRIPDLVGHALGVDLVQAQIGAALGDAVATEPRHRRHSAIRFLTADGPCTVGRPEEAVRGAHAVPGVVDAALYRATGAAAGPPVDFRDRLGHVTAVADDPDEAGAAAEAGIDRLRATLRYDEDRKQA